MFLEIHANESHIELSDDAWFLQSSSNSLGWKHRYLFGFNLKKKKKAGSNEKLDPFFAWDNSNAIFSNVFISACV